MIRSRLGRRVGAALAALLLLLNLAAPLAGASATSSNLPPIGWAETVSTFLMSCGIYPFETDENGNYTEWSAASLVPLWNQFREDVATVSNDIWDMVGYLVNGVIAIASGRWSVLREFASWIVSKFNVQDNQTGAQLGAVVSVPVAPYLSSISRNNLVNNGLRVPFSSSSNFTYSCIDWDLPFPVGAVAACPSPEAGTSEPIYRVYIYSAYRGNSAMLIWSADSWTTNLDRTSAYTSYKATNGKTVMLGYGNLFYSSVVPLVRDLGIPVFDTQSEVGEFFSTLTSVNGTFEGVTADTTTVSIPAELPVDTQYGGLTVAGAGAAVTVEALTEIVQEAVIEGLKPIINTVNVNLSPDIEVNPDTGEITQGEITITPADIDLVSSDYQIRQLHTVFPFSIPWDVANVLSALNAEPVRPYWEVSLTLPGILGQPDTQIPFTIGISDDSPLAGAVDNFAALARNFFLVLMCVGTLMLFRKR